MVIHGAIENKNHQQIYQTQLRRRLRKFTSCCKFATKLAAMLRSKMSSVIRKGESMEAYSAVYIYYD